MSAGSASSSTASSRIRLLITCLVAMLGATVVAGSRGADTATPLRGFSGITVFAGSSMTSVLPQIEPDNVYSFGSTGALATQITNGAPADVLMGANTSACASLYAAGTVLKPVNFTRNTLAVVVPKANPAGIKSIYDLTAPGVKIAVGATSAPVGSYTVQVLNQMNLNGAIQSNVVTQETSDANVVTKVALGQVDAGFVYLSDYVLDPTHLTLIKVPAWAQPKITYSMCVVAKSSNQSAAQAWVDKILSPSGQAVFVRDGFLPLTAPVPVITNLVPARGAPGVTVTICGSNLTGATSVTFKGIAAKFAVAGAKLLVTVPAKATSGPITVTNPSGTTNSGTFTVVKR